MQRSEINALIRKAERFFNTMRFHLPCWAYWGPQQWRTATDDHAEVFDRMLGWDITDFGSGDFLRKGLLLFTIRNGRPGPGNKPYAEKIMIVEENQETPMHFHWNKMEDIINRGGGDLVIELYNSTDDGAFAQTGVAVSVDGAVRRVPAGGSVTLTPGESICLVPGLYHRFYGKTGKGTVLVGEVSMVNDDASDNRFYEETGRFPKIEEDAEPYRLLVSDYKKYVGTFDSR